MIGILWSPKLSKENYASMPVWIKSSKRHYLLATKTGNWMKLEDVALGKVPSERECLKCTERKNAVHMALPRMEPNLFFWWSFSDISNQRCQSKWSIWDYRFRLLCHVWCGVILINIILASHFGSDPAKDLCFWLKHKTKVNAAVSRVEQVLSSGYSYYSQYFLLYTKSSLCISS